MKIENIDDIVQSKVLKKINIIVPAKNAKPLPPVGPILSQAKIKVKDFCNLFNDATKSFEEDFPIRVKIFIYKGELFDFITLTPSVSFLLKCYVENNGKITLLNIFKVSLIKSLDLKNQNIKMIFKNILLLMKSMNFKLKI